MPILLRMHARDVSASLSPMSPLGGIKLAYSQSFRRAAPGVELPLLGELLTAQGRQVFQGWLNAVYMPKRHHRYRLRTMSETDGSI